MKRSHLINVLLLVLISIILTFSIKAQSIGSTHQEAYRSCIASGLYPEYKVTKSGIRYIYVQDGSYDVLFQINDFDSKIYGVIIIPLTEEAEAILVGKWNSEFNIREENNEWWQIEKSFIRIIKRGIYEKDGSPYFVISEIRK